MDPDPAVLRAVEEIEAEASLASWIRDAADHYRVLAPLFEIMAERGADVEPLDPAANAARSVAPTARRSWKRILDASSPAKEAFRYRTWRASPGTCLVCGGRVGPMDRFFGAFLAPNEVDGIHADACMSLMARIGPQYGTLVVDEAIKLRDAPAPEPAWPEPDPTVDPDDASTWGVPGTSDPL